jgi:hypothetical protein
MMKESLRLAGVSKREMVGHLEERGRAEKFRGGV